MRHRWERKHYVFIGEKYGEWEVVSKERISTHKNRNIVVLCSCSCGTTREVPVRMLKSDRSRSCGCGTVRRSSTATKLLRQIWDGLSKFECAWVDWEDFYHWAIQTGYKTGATLMWDYRVPDYVGRRGYYWRVARKSRVGLGRKPKTPEQNLSRKI